jgi:carbon-monoxide dehydrogenase medium subunit
MAKLIAGGTALVLMMKQKLVQPEHLVSLAKVEAFKGVNVKHGYLHLGALTTHREIETSKLVKEKAPLLSDAFNHVATLRVREMATIGGGLVHADPAEDTPPALMALDASVSLSSSKAERIVKLDEFFQDYYTSIISDEEVLTDVIVPIPSRETKFGFKKFLPRTADDYGTTIVAVSLQLDNLGKCTSIRIALGSAGSVPLRAYKAEKLLEGEQITPELIIEAAHSVKSEIDPIEDVRGSVNYKRAMAAVFTKRAIEQALTV